MAGGTLTACCCGQSAPGFPAVPCNAFCGVNGLNTLIVTISNWTQPMNYGPCHSVSQCGSIPNFDPAYTYSFPTSPSGTHVIPSCAATGFNCTFKKIIDPTGCGGESLLPPFGSCVGFNATTCPQGCGTNNIPNARGMIGVTIQSGGPTISATVTITLGVDFTTFHCCPQANSGLGGITQYHLSQSIGTGVGNGTNALTPAAFCAGAALIGTGPGNLQPACGAFLTGYTSVTPWSFSIVKGT